MFFIKCFVSFLLFNMLLFGQSIGNITVGTPPGVSNQKPPFCAYSVADIAVSFEEMHNRYLRNTKKLEDEHYDETVLAEESENSVTYQLVFTHWLAGELFRLEEIHTKWKNTSASKLKIDHILPNNPNINAWTIEKTLMKSTKNSWVGDKFNELDIYIIFVELQPKLTRIYYQIAVDAEERRTLEASKKAARNGITDILNCK